MTASLWSPLVTSLLAAFLILYLAAFGLFHLMIYRVNRRLSVDERIPRSLYFGMWNRLRDVYKHFYPERSLYWAALMLATGCFTFAVAPAIVLFRQFAAGK